MFVDDTLMIVIEGAWCAKAEHTVWCLDSRHEEYATWDDLCDMVDVCVGEGVAGAFTADVGTGGAGLYLNHCSSSPATQ